MAQNLFAVMRICSAVVLSNLDAGFESRFSRKEFLGVCLLLLLLLLLLAGWLLPLLASWLLLLLKSVAHPDPEKGCKTSTG